MDIGNAKLAQPFHHKISGIMTRNPQFGVLV
jgi:hypothetical protein